MSGGPFKWDLILLNESDIFKIWTKNRTNVLYLKHRFVRSTTETQRRRQERQPHRPHLSCTMAP